MKSLFYHYRMDNRRNRDNVFFLDKYEQMFYNHPPYWQGVIFYAIIYLLKEHLFV